MVLPLPEDRDLIDSINVLAAESVPDALALARLKARAKKLVQANPGAGWSALGMIAGVEVNADEVEYAFKNAIRYRPHDAVLHGNYVVALGKVGMLGASSDVATALARRHPDDLRLLQSARECQISALRLEEAMATWVQLSKLNAELTRESDSKLDDIRLSELRRRMQERGATETDLLARAEAAARVLVKSRVPIAGTSFVFDSGEMLYMFIVSRTPEEAADLNWAIAETLVAQYEDTFSDLVTFSARPL